ncbi:MAG: GNAT family N-acetyltransferase [Muribaculaceae bacterium]|nr:GNAT family N-acetyltransferase [Muribaculaceae bacterium]
MLKDEKLLHDMSELWKDIFHDSDSYISLIINKKLDLSLCEWCYNDVGEMTSMIIGIPYIFWGHDSHFRGLYLCGVSTREEYRGKGEIQRLMHSVEARASDAGFDFTFLIPANENLRHFYAKKGYDNMSHFCKKCCINSGETLLQNIEKFNKMTECNPIIKLYNNDNSCIDKIEKKSLNSKRLFGEYVLKLLTKIERGSGRYFLCHTIDQWRNVYKDWLDSGNDIYYVYSLGEVYNPENVNYESMTLTDIVFINRNLINEQVKEELSSCRCKVDEIYRPYGMMKPLSRRVPDPIEFGISFMMD